MCSKNSASFIGIEGSSEYNDSLIKLNELVEKSNKRYPDSPYESYVKIVRYKKTGKTALFHSERWIKGKGTSVPLAHPTDGQRSVK